MAITLSEGYYRLGGMKVRVKRINQTPQSLNTKLASGTDEIPALLFQKWKPIWLLFQLNVFTMTVGFFFLAGRVNEFNAL